MPARAGLNLDKVTDAAVSLIEREGSSGLSLAKLAKELRVKPPSLYNHIGGIADLLRLVRLRGLRELGNDLQRAAVGRSGEGALRAVAHAYRAFALRHPALYTFTLESTERGDEELQQAGHEILEIVLAVLEGYGLKGDDAIHATRIIRSSLHGFLSLETGRGYALEVSTDETFERMLDYLNSGIRRKPRSNRTGDGGRGPGSDAARD